MESFWHPKLKPVSQLGHQKLKTTLQKLDERLEGRDYLADEFSLADVAYAGNFVRLRELEERNEVSIEEYPRVGDVDGARGGQG